MVERANVIWLNESDKKESMVIYGLVFPNNKIYVGQTRHRLSIRVNKDHSVIKSNQSNNRKERAVKKYKTFIVTLLDVCSTLDELNEKEIYWIKFFHSTESDSGYNSTLGGESYEMSDEHRRKIGDANRGRKLSDETRQNLSIVNKGKILSNEHRKKISESNKGKNLGKTFVKCKSIPDNIIFDSIGQCSEYYTKLYGSFKITQYLDNNRIHKKSGQTFVRIRI